MSVPYERQYKSQCEYVPVSRGAGVSPLLSLAAPLSPSFPSAFRYGNALKSITCQSLASVRAIVSDLEEE